MKFYEFLVLTTKYDELLNYLCTKNVIRKKIKCPRCQNFAELKSEQPLIIHCAHNYYKQIKKHKRKRMMCNFKISALNGTWFSQGLLSIDVICRLICYVMMMNTPRQIFLQKELDISSHTAVDWVNFCRELMYDCLIHNKTQIGGNGLIVEIDEAKFGRRKYNRGRLITGQWVFGGIERQTKKMFIIPVPSRKAEVLLPLIKDHIAPGSVIHSDCWKACQGIDKSTYQHHVVNHSQNFVDPDTGTHTQNIERLWRDMRGNIPRYGRRERHFNHYIAEFMFKKIFDIDKQLDAFFEIMAMKYPICENINE